jgi:hypothetical protein
LGPPASMRAPSPAASGAMRRPASMAGSTAVLRELGSRRAPTRRTGSSSLTPSPPKPPGTDRAGAACETRIAPSDPTSLAHPRAGRAARGGTGSGSVSAIQWTLQARSTQGVRPRLRALGLRKRGQGRPPQLTRSARWRDGVTGRCRRSAGLAPLVRWRLPLWSSSRSCAAASTRSRRRTPTTRTTGTE